MSSSIFLPPRQCRKDENLGSGAQSIAEAVAVDDQRRVHEHVRMAPEAPLVVDDVGAQQRLPREDTRQHFAHTRAVDLERRRIEMALQVRGEGDARHRRTPRSESLPAAGDDCNCQQTDRSEEHTSELQSLMRISYAVFCLKKKKNTRSYY